MLPNDVGPAGNRPALLVIDPQDEDMDQEPADYATSFGGGKAEVLDNINGLVAAARDADVPIVWAKELHRPDLADYGVEYRSTEPVHTLEGTAAENFEPRVDVDEDDMKPAEYVVVKRKYDLFHRTDLEHLLSTFDVDTLLLAGFMTHICVHYTAHGAHERDYAFRVVEECVGDPVSQYMHDAAMEFVRYLQTDGVQSLSAVRSDLADYEGNEVVRRVKETGSVLSEPQRRRAEESWEADWTGP